MSDRPLTYHEAIRILLDGTCGVHQTLVERETGVGRQCLMRFLRRERDTPDAAVDRLALFVWRKMNAHLLLCDEDRAPST